MATDLISARARASFERIFQRAAQSRLVRNAGDAVQIDAMQTLPEEDRSFDAVAAEVVVLTISSIAFRLVLLLRVQHDAATQAYYVGDAARTLRETFIEYGNLCCGAINQELIGHFPDLGMSTPYVLSARCVSYLDALKPAYQAMYAVTIDGTVPLQAMICVCANTPVDFMADMSAAVEESSGELEFF